MTAVGQPPSDSAAQARKRLQVSVRFEGAQAASQAGVAAGGRVGSRESRIDIRAGASQSGSTERIDQRIQVVEGGRAYISSGTVRTQPMRQVIRTPAGVVAQETYAVQETNRGFYVSPKVFGERVVVDVYAQREEPGRMPGESVQAQRVSTTASAWLGEWFELGAVDDSALRQDGGLGSASVSRTSESRRVWLKVEALPE